MSDFWMGFVVGVLALEAFTQVANFAFYWLCNRADRHDPGGDNR